MSAYPNVVGYTPPAENVVVTGPTYGLISTYEADIDMDSSANIQAVAQETQAIAGIHFFATSTLSTENTYKFLNSFDVSGYGPASLSVVVGNKNDFREVILAALEDAKSSIESQFDTDIENQLKMWIQNDDLFNTVQNTSNNVDVFLDTSSGATSMADGYETTPNYAEILYTQIPNTGLMVYEDVSEEPITSALPLQGGDKVTFVFSCTPQVSSITYSQSSITDADVTNDVAGQYSGNLTSMTAASRKFALTVTMAGSGKLSCARDPGATAPYLKA